MVSELLPCPLKAWGVKIEKNPASFVEMLTLFGMGVYVTVCWCFLAHDVWVRVPQKLTALLVYTFLRTTMTCISSQPSPSQRMRWEKSDCFEKGTSNLIFPYGDDNVFCSIVDHSRYWRHLGHIIFLWMLTGGVGNRVFWVVTDTIKPWDCDKSLACGWMF